MALPIFGKRRVQASAAGRGKTDPRKEFMTMKSDTTVEKCENPVARMERARPGETFIAPVDIVEQDDELLLFADLPGTAADAIDIDCEGGTLTLRARVEPREKNDGAKPILREYGVGDFQRTFKIGEGIDAERIRAEFHSGVLTLHLPKTEKVRSRKVAVSAN